MRFFTTTFFATIFTLSLVACDTDSTTDDGDLTRSAEEAMTYVDAELTAAEMDRDPSLLDDARLIEEAEAIAAFAEDHGCDVHGVLGGVYLSAEDEDGGTLQGRWFKLDRSIGGDLDGLYAPDPDAGGGVFEGDWEATDGQAGTLFGDYYGADMGHGDGVFLGQYAGDGAGMLGGLWYELLEDGGLFFGVWGQCGEDATEIEEGSY
jgi:hypothetical protein